MSRLDIKVEDAFDKIYKEERIGVRIQNYVASNNIKTLRDFLGMFCDAPNIGPKSSGILQRELALYGIVRRGAFYAYIRDDPS